MRAHLLVLSCWLCSCAAAPFPKYVPADASVAATLGANALFRAEPRVQMQARAVLERGDSAIDFSLIALIVQPREVRLAGLTDLGGKLFEATSRDGEREVRNAVPRLPSSLVESLLSTLEAVTCAPPASEVSTVTLLDGRAALHWTLGAHEVLAWRSDGAPWVDRWIVGGGGRTLRSVAVETWRAAEWPERVRVEETTGGQALTLVIAEWNARAARER